MAGSPCLDTATPPGSGQGVSLTPTEQYVHPVSHIARTTQGPAADAGAFER